jgi:hypothetical protein
MGYFDLFQNQLSFLDQVGLSELIGQTSDIVGSLRPANSDLAPRSVLVVGEVQSGKTLSFTSSLTMSRDQGYRVFVVVAGTKKNLRDQTYDRIVKDLPNEPGVQSNWVVFKGVNNKSWRSLSETYSATNSAGQATLSPVIVTMKTVAGLYQTELALVELSRQVGHPIEVLLIDDEADQASLNVANGDQTSAVYSALTKLRKSLPHHSYLMYTATSQAISLISLSDFLSPDRVIVLNPANSYVGSENLFVDPETRFALEIPDWECQEAQYPTQLDKPVSSFVEALRYFVFIAVQEKLKNRNLRPISMLIHPDRITETHLVYASWVRGELDYISQTAQECRETGDFVELIRIFEHANSEYQQNNESIFLTQTDVDLFVAELIANLPQIQVREINGTSRNLDIATKEWDKWPIWIVIGGEKLGRGFTVENLAVTYMPRSIGMGIADTVQQRARFLGHKRTYVSITRAWLPELAIAAFAGISEMDSIMREHLIQVSLGKEDFHNWPREFIFPTFLLPTRKKVIKIADLQISLISEGFPFKQRYAFAKYLSAKSSKNVIAGLLEGLFESAKDLDLDVRSGTVRHKVATISLERLTRILQAWPMHQDDRASLKGVIKVLEEYKSDNDHLNACVIFMDGLKVRRRKGHEDLNGELRIDNPLQGPSASNNYPGDRSMRLNDAITLQIHNIQPYVTGESASRNAVLCLALAWPYGYARTIYTTPGLAISESE